MGSGHTIDLVTSANHKRDVSYELFTPPTDSSFQAASTGDLSNGQIFHDDYHPHIFTGNEDTEEYAGELVERLSPSPEQLSQDSLTRSTAQPDVRLRLSGSSLLESLQLCTQLKLQLSTDQTTSGREAHVHNQGPESVNASWASNSVAPPGPKSEAGSDSELQEKATFTNCHSCTSPRTDSPIVQWIIARLENWQLHLDRLPTTGIASHDQHIHNIATALTQLEEEVKLIKCNLLGHTAEPEHDGISVADDCGCEDSRLVPHNLIVHVSSNTFLFSFEQLCYHMTEQLVWILGSVLDDSVVFWHYEQDEDGYYTEKPDACATLPNTEIMRLRCTDAFKFVNSVNRAEGETIFRVQTVLVREAKEWLEPE